MKTKYTDCLILVPSGNGHDVLRDCCLVTDGDIISYIGPEEGAGVCDAVKRMDGAVLMPGLVNAHGHGPMTLLRGAGCGLPLQEWLFDSIFPVEDRMCPEDIAAGQIWSVMEHLRSGVTLISEMYDYPAAAFEALLGTGIKANITRTGLSFSEDSDVPPARFDEIRSFMRDFRDPSGRVRPELSIHSEYLCSRSMAERIGTLAGECGSTVNMHVSETRREHEECKARRGGLTPIGFMNSCGVLDNPCYAAHCVWVDGDDMEIMAEKGVTAVFCPSSNAYLASGFAPVGRMAELGINIALGTDGCASNNNLNMFEEMHLSSLIRKNLAGDPTAAGASETLRIATVNGAMALGRHDTGELKAGMKADFCAVSPDAPHMFPAFDIPGLLVYSAQASDVVMTVADGRVLYDHGEFLTIDADRARHDMEKALKRIYG